MIRTFDQHSVRPTISLDGLWDFVTAPDRTDRTKLPRAYTRQIHVPSAWEQTPGLEAYRGKAWLRTALSGAEDLGVRLVFGGVSHTGDVYLDGKHLGHHYDAFTPWDVLLGEISEEPHELVVEVDNSFGDHSALHRENDYYTYGGITRPAEAQLIDAVYIDNVRATPLRKNGKWNLDVTITLKNWTKQPQRRRVLLQLDTTELDLGQLTVKPGASAKISSTFKNLDVEPWSSETPILYELTCLLLDGEEATDDMIDRIGFRKVAVRGKKLLLNGQPIRLRGYNRHEDHPLFGNSFPVEAMVKDLQLLRDLGCNFIRTSHYPNDLRFLDLCDEMGFCVWEESHARNVPFDVPLFRQQIADSTREMIAWHYNRPSIIMWGCLNECDSKTPAGREEHRRVIELIRKLDPTRPVTFASDKHQNDLCLDLVDIVSWNRYDAWYKAGIPSIEPAIKDMLKWLHGNARSGGKGKPVIMSEFGGGAIYGHRHPHHAKWTEEYLAEVLDESLRVYLNHPDIIGVAIWQFCDCRVTAGRWSGRPRTMNNKGTVDEYRRPKLAYDTVKKRMREAISKWERPKRNISQE